jgi:dihydroorotate dehydrogenase (NAD+) catalytic subunit
MAVDVAGIRLKNPVMNASGTFNIREADGLIDIKRLGAYIPKSITLHERTGNPVPRICETSSGMLNSIGLENKGVAAFIDQELPFLARAGVPVIVSIAGETIDEFAETVAKLGEAKHAQKTVKAVEINVSCPNIDRGGVQFGSQPEMAALVTAEIKLVSSFPIIVKLTPNTGVFVEAAVAVEEAGADAISLINTIFGMSIDIMTRKPKIGRGYGGLSGPAVKPIAVKMVYDVSRAVNIPVIGIGGIMNAGDAIEFLLAGATAVQVGTANFVDPGIMMKIISGISDHLEKTGCEDVREIIGKVEL